MNDVSTNADDANANGNTRGSKAACAASPLEAPSPTVAAIQEAQAGYDEQLLDDPEVRAGMRPAAQQRSRELRGRGEGRHWESNWRAQLEQHRDELRLLRREVDRVKAAMKAQARRATAEARAAKDEVKAASRDATAPLRGGGRRRGQ